MSEVKRYGHIGYLVNATDQLCELYRDMKVYVLASDYDSAQAELSALREELAKSRILSADQGLNLKRVKREFDASQQRLTAAEQRNATLVKALTATREALGREYWDQYAGLDETRDILDAVLKPTESGASE